MTTKLRQLLESIHPTRTLDETARCADEAINTFSAASAQITDWDEFVQCVVRFGMHVDGHVLHVDRMPEMGTDYGWGHYSKVLHEAYGPSGEKAAFEMVRTGVDGGLYGVLRRFAEIQATKYADNEINGRISQFWQDLSTDEQLRAMDEYLAEYGHLISSEMTENGAARLRMGFPRVLSEHPRLMQRLGQIGRG